MWVSGPRDMPAGIRSCGFSKTAVDIPQTGIDQFLRYRSGHSRDGHGQAMGLLLLPACPRTQLCIAIVRTPDMTVSVHGPRSGGEGADPLGLPGAVQGQGWQMATRSKPASTMQVI